MHLQREHLVRQLPAALGDALHAQVTDSGFRGFFTATEAAELQRCCNNDRRQLTLALLPLAASYAITPLSPFNVGAIAWGTSGGIYFGANLEFTQAPLQQTVHAEQSAIVHAWSHGEQALDAVTINYTPCGHCRQFMNELNSGDRLQIHLPHAVASLGDYLPDAFGPRVLNIDNLLLDTKQHGFAVEGTSLEQAAIIAANRSHAPYSQAYSGVALVTDDGTLFSGAYAENAAFNPSLPPLQAAMIVLTMSGYSLSQIRGAVLAETRQPVLSQQTATCQILNALNCQDIKQIILARP
ncbi:MAG: Cytidine deaminase [Candidatus Erwinia impunctatus]|nr:Cytidine deaminase [Culicoides impunctatus]